MSLAARDTGLERYETLGLLGEGAYGVVHEARDRVTGERVALKELTNVNASTLTRFKQEFRAVQEIHHPNLVRLDALLEEHGKWVIAMELVEGSDLLSYVYASDSDLGFRDGPLRETFSQLADGLIALHAAGFVHRDLKPSNVRVTPEGRVVLLDFGLATAMDARVPSANIGAFGTVAYMAPEQAAGERLGPATDWYAFGVCLYEALTGLLPIDAESPLALLAAKQGSVAPRASSHAPTIPPDLDELCATLLAIDPAARPGGSAIRARLARRSLQAPALGPQSGFSAAVGASSFEGRKPELAVLRQALARVRAGLSAVVLVEGDSGIGKSALVEHFLESIELRKPQTLVLRSRCYENELVAFKAFDGAVDGLARVLNMLSPAECEALLPPGAALLCRLFPALAAVRPLAELPVRSLAADPGAQRLEAFSLFARLLTSLSERNPIVLAIDDLQWADPESFQLLRTLLGGPHFPRCLILATVRPRAELEGDAAREIDALRRSKVVTDLPLEGLPREQAWTVARDLMGSAIPDSWLDVVVRETAGHPLFLSVLARFAKRHDPKTAADLTLDAAIAAHIGGLSTEARRLLQISALVGSPLAAPLCGRAAGLSSADLRRLLAELCSQKLLRRRRAGEISCFHDRIRRVAAECLSRAETKALHGRIATVLAAQAATDPGQLARHYEAAGDLALAHYAYRRAAEQASSALAFARGAVLLQRALDVSGEMSLSTHELSGLRMARGHALARAGQSGEAAAVFLDAAQDADGEDRTWLRLWAAQHLMQSARSEEGMAAARGLLAELGVPLPLTTFGVVCRLMWDRAYLSMRGMEVRPATKAIESHDRIRLDALWTLAMPVAWLDPLASAALSTQHLRLAHSLGEPRHIVRALAEEAFARTLQNPDSPKIDQLLTRARRLAENQSEPSLELILSFREATVATFRWDLPRARERLEHAQQLGTEHCLDQPWLLTNVRTNLASVWANMGEHAQLAASCNTWLAEALEHNDRFALTMIEGLGFGSFRHLMVDEPDRARATLDAMLAPWPRAPFSFAHLGELIGVTYAELYRGGDHLQRWLERAAPRLQSAFLLKVGLGKAAIHMYRGLASLAARNGRADEGRERLLDETRAQIRALRKIKSALAAIIALSFEAQLAALGGRTDQALQLARQVRALSESRSYDLAQRMTYLEGWLEGGEAGRAKQQSALKFFGDQGWRKPRRAIALLCPAIDELEAR